MNLRLRILAFGDSQEDVDELVPVQLSVLRILELIAVRHGRIDGDEELVHADGLEVAVKQLVLVAELREVRHAQARVTLGGRGVVHEYVLQFSVVHLEYVEHVGASAVAACQESLDLGVLQVGLQHLAAEVIVVLLVGFKDRALPVESVNVSGDLCRFGRCLRDRRQTDALDNFDFVQEDVRAVVADHRVLARQAHMLAVVNEVEEVPTRWDIACELDNVLVLPARPEARGVTLQALADILPQTVLLRPLKAELVNALQLNRHPVVEASAQVDLGTTEDRLWLRGVALQQVAHGVELVLVGLVPGEELDPRAALVLQNREVVHLELVLRGLWRRPAATLVLLFSWHSHLFHDLVSLPMIKERLSNGLVHLAVGLPVALGLIGLALAR